MNFEDWTLLRAARGGEKGRGGVKMNFSILTSTKVRGIKCRFLTTVDSESGRIFMIEPSPTPTRRRLGAEQGKNELPNLDLYESVRYQM